MLFAAFVGLLAAVSGAAYAQTYPGGPVKLIVPVPAGGVTDTMARIIAQRLTEAWGHPVVVDNRPGGNYAVGAQAVARSPADGLTLLVAPDSTVTANPHLFSKLPYDPVKDLTPIIVLCRITPVLVVNPSLDAKSVPELIALAKAKPGSLNYGSYGIGPCASEHGRLQAEDRDRHRAHPIAAPRQPRPRCWPAMFRLLNLSSIEEHEKAGKVRILAVASDKRAVLRPALPTVAEAGVPGFSTTAWFALWGPPNMAPELVARIHADVAKVLESPQSREFFRTNSFERVDLSPAQFSQLIQDDLKHWGALVKAVGAKLD